MCYYSHVKYVNYLIRGILKMKRMRKVVSTLLLVCILASMVVSASADSVSIKYTLESQAQGGNTYQIEASEALNIQVVPTISDGATDTYSLVWYVDGTPVSTEASVVSGTQYSYGFEGWYWGEGTHTVQPFLENETTFQKAGQASSVKIVVAEAIPTLTGVVFNKDAVQLKRNAEAYPVFASKVPAEAAGTIVYTVEDASGDPSNVAAYDVNRQAVVATNEGTAYLVATVWDGSDVLARNSIPVYVTVPVSSITIDTQYLENPAEGDEIHYTIISDSATWPQLQWTSSNSKVASVSGDNGAGTATITLGGSNGTATITASSTDGTAVNGKCIVSVNAGGEVNTTFVEVTPVKAELYVGETVYLTAYVTGKDADGDTSYFDHWYCSSGAVSITRDGNNATVKAVSAVTNPVEVRAYANDGKYGYALIYITKSEPLEITASDTTVKANKTVVVSVDNARPNETFTWTYSPEDVGFVKSTSVKGNNFSIVGGDLEGSITVTCTSNNDSTRTASVMVGINSVDPYGSAYITPGSVNWVRGNGDLSFQVSPAAYYTYLDNQYLNTKSTSLATYWNGTLTLKAAYLNTLSNGTHTLKVYTATDEGNNPTGLVYANIYVSGNGTSGASAAYGDNAHVKGAASNLYFNSSNAISDVYISGKWIDPANYSLSTDGKTLTLSSSFLNQLAYGSYTMQLNGTNGSTQTTNFRIVTANYAPSTGDDTSIGLWVAIMLLSGAGAIALIPKKKNSAE